MKFPGIFFAPELQLGVISAVVVPPFAARTILLRTVRDRPAVFPSKRGRSGSNVYPTTLEPLQICLYPLILKTLLDSGRVAMHHSSGSIPGLSNPEEIRESLFSRLDLILVACNFKQEITQNRHVAAVSECSLMGKQRLSRFNSFL